MRIPLRQLSLAAGSYALFAVMANAQEPTPAPTPPTEAPKPAMPPEQPADHAPAADEPKIPVLVIEAGTVHPVSGPAIPNGVVVIDVDRIVAVGKKGEVEIPADAVVRSFPTGHVYPGLIDAATDAFTDVGVRNEAGVDAGAQLFDAMQLRHDREDDLLAAGITTAYVTVRSPGLVRPRGALVRPTRNAFAPWQDKSGATHDAVQLRLTNGLGPTHALQRQQMLQSADALFEGLDEYTKAKKDHDEALKKYEKEFADYLAWHKKKKDGEKAGDPKDEAKPPAAPADAAPAAPPEGGRRRGVRPGGGGGGGGGGGEPPRTPSEPRDAELPAPGSDEAFVTAFTTLLEILAQDPPKQDPPKQDPKPATNPPAGGAPGDKAGDKPAETKDEPPKRPTYPKAPPRDPQRDALQDVLAGKLPLRVEVHRADEVRAALAMQQKRTIPVLIVEQAYGAAECAPMLAERGIAVVLTDLLPADLPEPYDAFDAPSLPAKLQAAGVPFAIASGAARRASVLPLLAASAIGAGLDRDAALRAITLSPAEILGIAAQTGSLQKGKLADVVVCDRPLFATDSRVLFVLQEGRTAWEAK